MTKILLFTFLCLSSLIVFADGAPGEGSYSMSGTMNFQKKAEQKESSRWTLSEWMRQKDTNHAQDMWLSMHSGSPYELILTSIYQDYTLTSDNPVSTAKNYNINGSVAFYALILGIEGFYQNNWQESYVESGGLIALRLLGRHVQNTHLILQGGTQSRKSASFNYNQNFGGVDLDLYVERHSGLHGNYRYYFPTTDSSLGNITENRWEAGLFWDISFVKLMVGWSVDAQTNSINGSTTSKNRSGLYSGVKLFF